MTFRNTSALPTEAPRYIHTTYPILLHLVLPKIWTLRCNSFSPTLTQIQSLETSTICSRSSIRSTNQHTKPPMRIVCAAHSTAGSLIGTWNLALQTTKSAYLKTYDVQCMLHRDPSRPNLLPKNLPQLTTICGALSFAMRLKRLQASTRTASTTRTEIMNRCCSIRSRWIFERGPIALHSERKKKM